MDPPAIVAPQVVGQVLGAESLGSVVEAVRSVPAGLGEDLGEEIAVLPVDSGAVPVDLEADDRPETVKCTTRPVTDAEMPVRFPSVQTAASPSIAATVSKKTMQLLSVTRAALHSAETVEALVVVIHATTATRKSVCLKRNVQSATANARFPSVQTEKSPSTVVPVSANPKWV